MIMRSGNASEVNRIIRVVFVEEKPGLYYHQ